MSLPLNVSAACSQVVDMPRTLVNLMLYGGMDSKFLFMPAPAHFSSSGYLDKIWAARSVLYDGSYTSYTEMFDNEYLLTNHNGFEFGIFKRCAWLKSEFDAGRLY